MSQHDAKPVSPAPVQYPHKTEVRPAVIDRRDHLERRVAVGCTADTAHRRKLHPSVHSLLQQACFVDSLVHLLDGQPAVLQCLFQGQSAHRHISGRVDGDAKFRHIEQRHKGKPLRVELCTFQLEGKIHLPFFQAAPDLAAVGTPPQNRGILQAQVTCQGKHIIHEHPHCLMTPCDDQMSFRRVFLLLHRAGMAHRLLIQGYQLLCLGVKILPRRSQHHTARYMLEQLKLQLPFQRANLLRKCRLRKIQCLCRRRKAVHFHDLYKAFQCALVHAFLPPAIH